MKIVWALLGSFALQFAPASSMAAGGGSMGGMGGMESTPSATPQELAKRDYNSGVRYIAKAKDLEDDADKAAMPEKKQKLLDKAQKQYGKAADEFKEAVGNDASLYQAWSYLGFALRHLGNYDAALGAYARALQINPSYGEAVEYRAEALLGLNRIEDAKTAYMTLFGSSRTLADQLMSAMKRWVATRQTNPSGVSTDELAGFSQWVDERSDIARQTASLATDGAAAAWK
jgi:tetratricopeptide (TPR) repeat protein